MSRCYYVWNRQLVVVVVPAILCLACNGLYVLPDTTDDLQLNLATAVGLAYIIDFNDNAIGLIDHINALQSFGPLYIAFLVFDFCSNLLLTSLLAGRIFVVVKQARASIGGGLPRFYSSIIVAILESGSLYPLTLLSVFIFNWTWGLSSVMGSTVILLSMIHIVCIASTLMVVLVGTGSTFQDEMPVRLTEIHFNNEHSHDGADSHSHGNPVTVNT
ncbi:hypothetical protein PM082_015302 [Marasmius tenuissimus]|nr:hypothetical protein PM082_015302 [Marasmius tenuissimus]